MHELAIAAALVDLVRRRTAPGDEVAEVRVDVGALTGIVPECLAFYYDGLTRETPLEGSRLRCRRLPARVRCGACAAVYEPEGFAPVCTACGGLGGEVLQGRELDLARIEMRSAEHV